MEPDLVSVIIPAFNHGWALADAIESVLNQSYQYLELIIVDDGSMDGTKRVTQTYLQRGEKFDSRVKYIYQNNQGKVAALKTGIANSNGTFIAILDADDTYPASSISVRIAVFKAHPEVMSVYGDANKMDEHGAIYGIKKSRPVKNKKELVDFFRNPIASSSLMIKRDFFERLFKFDTTIKRLTDVEQNLQLYLAGKMYYLPKMLLNFRTYNRKGAVGLRLKYIFYFWKIVNKYFTGWRKYNIMMKQILFQSLKMIYGLFNWKK